MIFEVQQLCDSGWASSWLIMTFSLGPATPGLAGCLPLLSFSLYFFASSLPPSLISPLHLSLRHAHQHGQVGAFKGRRCVQSNSGKGLPLPNQSTYLIHLSQGWGLISYIHDKTGGNLKDGLWDGEEKRRNQWRWDDDSYIQPWFSRPGYSLIRRIFLSLLFIIKTAA